MNGDRGRLSDWRKQQLQVTESWRKIITRSEKYEIDVGVNSRFLMARTFWTDTRTSTSCVRRYLQSCATSTQLRTREDVRTIVPSIPTNVPNFEWLSRKIVRVVLRRSGATDAGIVEYRIEEDIYDFVPVT